MRPDLAPAVLGDEVLQRLSELGGVRQRPVHVLVAEHLRRRLTLEEAAIAKLYSTESLGSALDTMVQLHGGYGYMLEYPVARAFVDDHARVRLYSVISRPSVSKNSGR